ncbi:MAG: serine/threonine-protein phosphatase, partial [Planctomycetes bacterium]|nr:serine/threonine-protein phosphatase [Planctomycetota bacterium]
MSLTEHDTQELPASMMPLPDTAFDPITYQFAAASHVGLRRSTNEDHFAVVRRIRTREILMTNANTAGFVRPQAETYALVVADGLGGAGHGDLASELILRIGWDIASAEPSWTMKFRPEQWTELSEYVNNLAQRMQRELLSHSDADPRLAGMGTTWTCYYLMGQHAVVAHVGDSRAYLFRKGQLQQISRDHNFAQQLEACGVSPEEAAPFRHILTNAFGASDGKIEVDVQHVPLQHGDRLLL